MQPSASGLSPHSSRSTPLLSASPPTEDRSSAKWLLTLEAKQERYLKSTPRWGQTEDARGVQKVAEIPKGFQRCQEPGASSEIT